MKINTNPIVELNEIPSAVDPRTIVHRKAILITIWSSIGFYFVLFITALVLNFIYSEQAPASWEISFTIFLVIARYTICAVLLFDLVLLLQSKKSKFSVNFLLSAAIFVIFALATMVIILDFTTIINSTDSKLAKLWATVVDALTTVALILVTSAGVLVTFLLKTPKKVTLPEPTHERIL